jgi:hypothetical protein
VAASDSSDALPSDRVLQEEEPNRQNEFMRSTSRSTTV